MANFIKQRLRKHTLGIVWMVIKTSKNIQLGVLMPEMWGYHMDLVCASFLPLLLKSNNLVKKSTPGNIAVFPSFRAQALARTCQSNC